MEKQLFSLAAIAEELKRSAALVKNAAIELDLAYDLSLDGVWYFSASSVAKIRAALGV